MRERILAVLGAVCLIAVAIVLRQAFSGDDGADGGRSPGRGDRPVVACTSDLGSVCDALVADGEIADDPPTLDLADAADPPTEIDAWVTWDPAPQIADDLAGSVSTTGGPWSRPRGVAGGRLALLVAPEVEAGLAESCGGRAKVTWACVAEYAADQRRAIGTGPADTAEGLARLLPLASTLADDLDPETLDTARLRTLLESPVNGQDTAPVMAQLLVTRPGALDLVVGPVDLLRDRAGSSQGRARDLQVVIPTPLASTSVVVVPRQGRTVGDLVDQVRQDRSKDALFRLGLVNPGRSSGDDVAGFLYQVLKKVG